MPGTFKVLMDREEFCIVGPDGEVGEEVDYDNVATLTIDKELYICRVEDPDAPKQRVERVTETRVMDTEIEEVRFADDNDEDEGGEDPDGDDGERVETVIEEDDEGEDDGEEESAA